MCITPIPIRQDSPKWAALKPLIGANSDVINVPCGRCLECRRSYINQWVVRLMAEYKAPTTLKAYFVTLTYDDDNLYNPDNGLISSDGEFTLNYSHHQKFIKRLRKSYNYENRIKYFSVGEYGDRSDRPHFHTILFNADQQKVLDTWGHGNVHFGEVSESSIAYTLKYAVKKLGRVYKNRTGKKDSELFKCSRAPEKPLISKGLGLVFVEDKQTQKFYNENITAPIILEGGTKVALPRYYKQKLLTDAQLQARSTIALKAMETDRRKSPEQIRETQVKSQQKFKKEEAKQKGRKITGY